MITLKPLFITAIAGLVLLILGCTSAPTTHENPSAVQSPTPALTIKISIISDPPGARIEINNNYVGDASLEVDSSAFHWLPGLGHDPVTITATPRENGYVQSKYWGPFDPAPSRVLFQMNLRPVTNQ